MQRLEITGYKPQAATVMGDGGGERQRQRAVSTGVMGRRRMNGYGSSLMRAVGL